MNESEFYNQQYDKYKKYEHQRAGDRELNLEKISEQLKANFSRAGFTDVLSKDFLYDDDFNSSDDLIKSLHQVPIFDNFSKSDYPSINSFCESHKEHRTKLDRHRVVLLARKST